MTRRNNSESEMDLLEAFSRDLDENDSDKNTKMGTINFELDDSITPCLSCKKIMNCPEGISSSEMETLRECDKFEPIDLEKQNVTEKLHENSHQDILDSHSDNKNAAEKKKELINSILSKWKSQAGKIRIFCQKCEAPMIKRISQKKELYFCPNYPECRVQANPWYIFKAIDEGLVTNRLKADLIVVYKYDETKNLISVSEIYSEKKIFT
ncbi:MAG: hypothetical protein ACTSWY_03880 [Promethearchaeota archaeon]